MRVAVREARCGCAVAMALGVVIACTGCGDKWKSGGRVDERQVVAGEYAPGTAGRTCAWALADMREMIVCADPVDDAQPRHWLYSCYDHFWVIMGSGRWDNVTGGQDCQHATKMLVKAGVLPTAADG